MQYGCQQNIKNMLGRTAKDDAIKSKDKNIIDIFLKTKNNSLTKTTNTSSSSTIVSSTKQSKQQRLSTITTLPVICETMENISDSDEGIMVMLDYNENDLSGQEIEESDTVLFNESKQINENDMSVTVATSLKLIDSSYAYLYILRSEY